MIGKKGLVIPVPFCFYRWMKSGIYYIKNVVSGKMYIGSTTDLVMRPRWHFSALKQGKHSNPHLQHTYNKYGKDNLEYVVLEGCPAEMLEEREQAWIDYYDSTNHDMGYNIRTSKRNCPLTDEQKAKQSASLKAYYREHPVTEEQKIRNSMANTGVKRSEETKERCRLAQIEYAKTHTNSEETRRKKGVLGNKHALGTRWTEEQKAKLRIVRSRPRPERRGVPVHTEAFKQALRDRMMGNTFAKTS